MRAVAFKVCCTRSVEEAEMQARGERINRDGEVVGIEDEADVQIEEVFDEGAAPDAEDLAAPADDEADSAAEAPAEAASDDGAEDPEKTDS